MLFYFGTVLVFCSTLALLFQWQYEQYETNSVLPSSFSTSNEEDFLIAAYLGEWYQISDIPQFYETQCSVCTKTTYGIHSTSPLVLTVFNQANDIPFSTPSCSISGLASIPNPNEPTKLKVVFPGVPNSPNPKKTNYWIVLVGPLNPQGFYEWSAVSDPLKITLYILNRTPEMDPNVYVTVVNELRKLGYKTDNLKMTPQIGCTYG